MSNEKKIYSGGEGESDPPLSRAEELLHAHPDIKVIRSMYGHGSIDITQRIGHRWRNILVDVKHEEGSQRHYPTVVISAYETPRNVSPYEDISKRIRSYGLETLVKVHVEDDEQVRPEVGYNERLPYPHDFKKGRIEFIELYSLPIPAQELVTTARIGLEMLKAYREASLDQQVRIYENNFVGKWDNIIGQAQIYDGEPGRRDMDAYIAEASPLFANAMRRSGLSLNHIGTKSIYALNALNKVTDAMLPQEMPPAPKNRKEPARRTRPPGR